jgi:hypothetical protein
MNSAPEVPENILRKIEAAAEMKTRGRVSYEAAKAKLNAVVASKGSMTPEAYNAAHSAALQELRAMEVTLEEATNAAGVLANLLLKYGISVEKARMLRGSKEEETVAEEWVSKGTPGFRYYKRRIWWQEQLARIVTQHTGCGFFITKHSNSIGFIGASANRKVAIHLHVMLSRLIDEVTDKSYRREYQRQRASGIDKPQLTNYRVSFVAGALELLSRRLKKAHDDAVATDQKFALMVINKNALAIQKYMQDAPELKAHKPRDQRVETDGFWAGYEWAKTIPLNSAVENTSNQAVPLLQ